MIYDVLEALCKLFNCKLISGLRRFCFGRIPNPQHCYVMVSKYPIAYSLVSDCFFLMLQHVVTPNSVGPLVAWQQEDGVHVFTVKVKTWGENWNVCVLIEAEGCLQGLSRWNRKAKTSRAMYSRPGSYCFFPGVQQINLGPWADKVVLNSDSF